MASPTPKGKAPKDAPFKEWQHPRDDKGRFK